jgi:hypothetical protein
MNFRKWLELPRFVRELGAAYTSGEDMLTMRNIRTAFDAIVIIRKGHDSSPTATGVRKVSRE